MATVANISFGGEWNKVVLVRWERYAYVPCFEKYQSKGSLVDSEWLNVCVSALQEKERESKRRDLRESERVMRGERADRHWSCTRAEARVVLTKGPHRRCDDADPLSVCSPRFERYPMPNCAQHVFKHEPRVQIRQRNSSININPLPIYQVLRVTKKWF